MNRATPHPLNNGRKNNNLKWEVKKHNQNSKEGEKH